VFHVSPFCALEGGYRFRFTRFMRQGGEHTLACIDHDDAGGALLQTSVAGQARPICNASVARAFFAFPLMTLGVVVRIHVQALRLWCKRVPFFSKPEPPRQKVTR